MAKQDQKYNLARLNFRKVKPSPHKFDYPAVCKQCFIPTYTLTSIKASIPAAASLQTPPKTKQLNFKIRRDTEKSFRILHCSRASMILPLQAQVCKIYLLLCLLSLFSASFCSCYSGKLSKPTQQAMAPIEVVTVCECWKNHKCTHVTRSELSDDAIDLFPIPAKRRKPAFDSTTSRAAYFKQYRRRQSDQAKAQRRQSNASAMRNRRQQQSDESKVETRKIQAAAK